MGTLLDKNVELDGPDKDRVSQTSLQLRGGAKQTAIYVDSRR